MQHKQVRDIASWQIKLIHVAANELNLIWKDEPEQDPYHQILSGFISTDGNPASSCKQLNNDQANLLLGLFKKMGFKSQSPRANQYESLFRKDRPDQFATVAQLGMLLGMWADNSREKTLDSLNKFTSKIVKISSIEWLLKIHVPKMIEAIKNL
jgi:hypothetical protein